MSAVPAISSPLPQRAAGLDAAAQRRWHQLQRDADAFIDRIGVANRKFEAAMEAALMRVTPRDGFRVVPAKDRLATLDKALAKLPTFGRLTRHYKRTETALKLVEVRLVARSARHRSWDVDELSVGIVKFTTAFSRQQRLKHGAWLAALCGLHSLSRNLQRGSGGGVGLLTDLTALVDALPAAVEQITNDFELRVEIPSGVWRGRLVLSGDEPLARFQTFV